MSIEKKDIFQRVTDQIVKAIEEGAGSYRMPWRTSGAFPQSPINAGSKRPYRGINVLVLWAIAQERGYKTGTWATYKQWQELAAQGRKGEKSANVVFSRLSCSTPTARVRRVSRRTKDGRRRHSRQLQRRSNLRKSADRARTATEALSDAARNDPMGFYNGMAIKHGKNAYVLCGPPAT